MRQRGIHTKERKAFIHKLRHRIRQREIHISEKKEGIHPQAQVQDETEQEIQNREKKAFIPQLIIGGDREGETREKVVILNQNRKK
jgi:hypothetical protein